MENLIKIRRKDKKLSQSQLAERLGTRVMTISRWERGEHLPNQRYWPKIEEVLGLTPSQLVECVRREVA